MVGELSNRQKADIEAAIISEMRQKQFISQGDLAVFESIKSDSRFPGISKDIAKTKQMLAEYSAQITKREERWEKFNRLAEAEEADAGEPSPDDEMTEAGL